jgi:hypothetical protein
MACTEYSASSLSQINCHQKHIPLLPYNARQLNTNSSNPDSFGNFLRKLAFASTGKRTFWTAKSNTYSMFVLYSNILFPWSFISVMAECQILAEMPTSAVCPNDSVKKMKFRKEHFCHPSASPRTLFAL